MIVSKEIIVGNNANPIANSHDVACGKICNFVQNFRFSAVLDGGRASHQPDDPQLISYGSCGRSAAVRGISSVLQYRGIVKDAQKDRK